MFHTVFHDFIDVLIFARHFDTVSHSALWKSLSDFGAPRHFMADCQTTLRPLNFMDSHTDQIQFEKGVRQGCIVSPLLFNACGEDIMWQVQETLADRSGCIIGGRAIWNKHYADDSILLARKKIWSGAASSRELDRC